MAVPPPAPRQRPSSARARLLRERSTQPSIGPEEASVLSHGCSDPPPESQCVQSGPGHFRHFASTSRHEIKDPLGQGEGRSQRDLPFYSMGRRSSSHNRENGAPPMRVVDFSKVNKDRHKWQRLDTFQTACGNGSVRCDTSQQRTRTSSREPGQCPAPGQGAEALAGLGLEIEDLRLELRSMVEEVKEACCSMTNHTIAELRQDVRAEAAALRQQLSETHTSFGVGDEERTAMLTALAKEVDSSREEVLRGQNIIRQELQRFQTEALTKLQKLSHGVEPLEEVANGTKQLQSAVQAVADDASASAQAMTEAVLKDLEKVRTEFLAPLRNTLLEREGRVLADVDLSPILEGLQDLRSDFSNVDHRSTLLACLAESGIPVSLSEVQARLAELEKLSLLEEMKHWVLNFDPSPLIGKAVCAAVQETMVPVDLSPVMAGIKSLRKEVADDVAAMLPSPEVGNDAPATKRDVTAMMHELTGISELVSHCSTAAAKADITCLHSDLQSVCEEVRGVRAMDVSKMLRILQQLLERPEAPDMSQQVLRALQDQRRAEEESSEKLLEELHKLRRDCDVSEVLSSIQQIDSSKILRAIRESKGLCSDDLVPFADELRRMSEELRQARFSAKEISQLLDEVTSVKMDVQRQGRREMDSSTVLHAIREKISDIDFSEVHRELKQSAARLHDSLELFREEQRAAAAVPVPSAARTDHGDIMLLKAVEEIRRAVSNMDVAPVNESLREAISELGAVKAKIELSSALKRQCEHMTKADFSAGLEELRGHFSLVLSSVREVWDGGAGASAASGVNTRLEQLLKQRTSGREDEPTCVQRPAFAMGRP
eukprot:TRINITY_DN48960_c0_g1_i1.p1 TRINITY_DN48960_c0_g1~~TRINITY_DN48960_c0_g1_i1.p1  ORF type:complete len:837 (-),score=191.36 TRINITY_DN48960_c0_g1_i1:136-2625(-)